APYALMGSEMLAKYTSASLKNANSALMTNHGAIAIGISLFEAFDRMEVLENSAKITIFTGLIGKTTEMNDKALDAINKFMER
ncbi:MAG: class II aldolase/adducin family protein, partial [Verrucomicrobiota bacterium]|nr:class II aldolase/adducin family protein [Verrucomicrobiota bacterium]